MARLILELDPNVRDLEEVVVLLESVGLSRDSLRSLGYQSIGELAGEVFSAVQELRSRFAKYPQELPSRVGVGKALLIGLAFNTPWLFMMLSLFGLGLAYISFNISPSVGTSIGMAFIFSLIASGGLQQAFTRKYLYYYSQENFLMAWQTAKAFFVLGVLFAWVSTIIFSTILYFFYPVVNMVLTSTYFLLLYLLWVMVIPLYAALTSRRIKEILKLPAAFSPLLLLSWPLYLFLGQSLPPEASLIVSQLISLAVTLVLTLYLTWPFGAAAMRHAYTGLRDTSPRMPRLGITLYYLAPYFLYGTLYYLFVFADRLLVWRLTGPYPFTIDPFYEMVMGLAMLGLLPAIAVDAYFVFNLPHYFTLHLEETPLWMEEALGKRVWRRIRPAYLFLLALNFEALLLVLFAETFIFQLLGTPFPNPIVLASGAVGYFLLGVFILNSQILLFFNRVWDASAAVAGGLAANLLTGLILTQLYGDPYLAAIGLAVGSMTLAAVSTVQVSRRVRNLAYVAYSSI